MFLELNKLVQQIKTAQLNNFSCATSSAFYRLLLLQVAVQTQKQEKVAHAIIHKHI